MASELGAEGQLASHKSLEAPEENNVAVALCIVEEVKYATLQKATGACLISSKVTELPSEGVVFSQDRI